MKLVGVKNNFQKSKLVSSELPLFVIYEYVTLRACSHMYLYNIIIALEPNLPRYISPTYSTSWIPQILLPATAPRAHNLHAC